MKITVKKTKTQKSHGSGCLICGAELVYGAAVRRVCAMCGGEFDAEAECAGAVRHFVCDACHSRGAVGVIEAVCRATASTDAWTIAAQLLRSPAVAMHGPEHHLVTGAALLAAYCNATGSRDRLDAWLATVLRRGAQVPGGTCGHWGACGAAIGAGIFLAAVTESTPMTRLGSWKSRPDLDAYALGNRLSARCLAAVGAVGGPRCCKRSVGLVIRESVAFLREEVGVVLPESEIACEFSARNRDCKGERCDFYAE